MTVYLPETEFALSSSRAHLKAHPETDPSIASYLTRYIVVRMCAEIEQTVDDMIKQKVSNEASPAVAAFVSGAKRSIVRNAKFSEICDQLKMFGTEYLEAFSTHVLAAVDEGGIESLGNAVKARNDVGHNIAPDLTFGELEKAYETAEKVVTAVAQTLSLTTANET